MATHIARDSLLEKGPPDDSVTNFGGGQLAVAGELELELKLELAEVGNLAIRKGRVGGLTRCFCKGPTYRAYNEKVEIIAFC